MSLYGPSDEGDSLRLLVEAAWRSGIECEDESDCSRPQPELRPDPIDMGALESMRARAAAAAAPVSALACARSRRGSGLRRQGLGRTVSFAEKIETREIPLDVGAHGCPSGVSKPGGAVEPPEEPAKCCSFDSVVTTFFGLTPFNAGAGGLQTKYGSSNLLAMRACTLPGIGAIRR